MHGSVTPARRHRTQRVRRYATNPLFLQRIAEVHDTSFHDPASSAIAYRELLERADAESVFMPAIAEVRARLASRLS